MDLITKIIDGMLQKMFYQDVSCLTKTPEGMQKQGTYWNA
jgi:hypothetical protein